MPQQPAAAPAEPEAPVPPEFAGGRKIFDANCARCHSVGGATGGRGKRGPNLAKEGAKHEAEWVAAYVTDPKSKKPESRMPSFGNKLSAEDIRAVADYIGSLK
jgi:mono/diheme cytochrome c family protein